MSSLPPKGRIRSIGEAPLPLHKDHIGCVGFITTNGVPVGTCFIVTLADPDLPPHLGHGYVVTARHVLYNKRTGSRLPNLKVRFRELDGDRVQDLDAHDWVEHPIDDIDVAVAPIDGVPDFPTGSLSMDLHPFDLTDIEAVLGQAVYYVGLFAPVDKMGAEGVPMVRSGTVGAISQLIHPEGKDGPFEAHLIDCRSYGGFSGSPVYIQVSLPSMAGELSKKGQWEGYSISHRIQARNYWTWLWGLLIIHYTDLAAPDAIANMGVGIVIPVERIRDVLNTKRLIDLRRDDAVQIRAAEPGVNVVAQDASALAPEIYTEAEFLGDLRKVSRPVARPEE